MMIVMKEGATDEQVEEEEQLEESALTAELHELEEEMNRVLSRVKGSVMNSMVNSVRASPRSGIWFNSALMPYPSIISPAARADSIRSNTFDSLCQLLRPDAFR